MTTGIPDPTRGPIEREYKEYIFIGKAYIVNGMPANIGIRFSFNGSSIKEITVVGQTKQKWSDLKTDVMNALREEFPNFDKVEVDDKITLI